MRTFRRRLQLTLCLAASAGADTLTGTFSFEESPPSVALVYFSEDHSRSKASKTVVEEKNKQFLEKMVVGAKGTEIVFKNSDSVEHDLYVNDPKTKVNSNAGVVSPGEVTRVAMNWDEGEVARVGCKIHPRMQAYVANISSSHYAIVEFKSTDRKTGFKIENIPEGLSRVRVWFPKHEAIEADLKEGAMLSLPVAKGGKKDGDLSLSRR
ncbi:MAG: hypothetical protein JWO30_434 [Fibrobacteres bacterium]|nr:hypothetical protein [Fibrobacterota bacterium]